MLYPLSYSIINQGDTGVTIVLFIVKCLYFVYIDFPRLSEKPCNWENNKKWISSKLHWLFGWLQSLCTVLHAFPDFIYLIVIAWKVPNKITICIHHSCYVT